MFGRRAKKHCPHWRLRGIYGDEAMRTHYRLQCQECGAFLDGPVELAAIRVIEWELYLGER